MIREGGYNSAASSNVLTDTQFQQITQQMRMKIRARQFVSANASTAFSTVRFTQSATVLSDVQVNQQLANVAASSNQSPPGEVRGLNDGDIVFEGLVNPGTLQLSVPAGTIWDVTAY